MRKGFKHIIKTFSAGIFYLLLSQHVNAQYLPPDYTNGIPVNYVRTWDATAPEQDANTLMGRQLRDVKQTTQYIDGLGRLLQTVMKKGSMVTGAAPTDLVSPLVYDEFGREQYRFLPYAEPTAATGAFKLNPFSQQAAFYNTSNTASPIYNQNETYLYSKTNFEASPLNRVNDTYAPGDSWVKSETNPDPAQRRNTQIKYLTNTATDDVHVWKVNNNMVMGTFGTYGTNSTSTGIYAAGELYKTITIDEHKKQVIEFKDKEGKVILKKVQLSTTAGIEDDGTGRDYSGWLCTYYIYDDLNNLRCVIQPEAVKTLPATNWQLPTVILNEQCFRYEYDQRNRMITKKVPGAGEVYMIYDARDRLVMMQDANMRTGTAKWMVTRYDELNRPAETGLWTNTTACSTHLANAAISTNYPVASSGYEQLTLTHYDDYTGVPGGLSATYLTNWNANFAATSNSNWPYPQMPAQSNAVKGMPAWTQVKVLGTSNTYLYTVIFYDDKGRPVQTQSKNLSGGIDVTTTQYSWAGQPLVMVQKQQQISSGNPQEHIVITKMLYDDLGKLLNVKKIVNSNINSVAVTKAEQLIVQNEYDKLGQLKKKALGANNLENLNYDYNIRGWLLGMNRSYLVAAGQSGSNKFGFELGYDKLSGSSGRNFTAAQYNGNINGMVWKSDGDDVKRKFDYTYDAANRLLKGQFEQDDATSSWNNTNINYSMQMGNGTDAATAYDDNGNIKAMTQFGWKLGSAATVPLDNLHYTYLPGTNRLKSVTDFNNDAVTKLGDFKTNTTHPQSTTKAGLTAGSSQAQFDAITDYSYDVNGNLVLDDNKAITSITYNHLNLPNVITVQAPSTWINGSRTITYTYDAAGNKLKKEVFEYMGPNASRNIITDYVGGFVYSTKLTNPGGSPEADDHTNVLQFLPQEEGRIRFKPAASNIAASFQYDYMLKDHLGNVRMVLTEEQQQDQYPAATMETAQTSTEESLYANLNTTRIDKPAGYPTDNYTTPNDKVARVSAGSNPADKKVGPSITLKVMAGDKFNVRVSSWYKTYGATPGTPLSPLADVLTALINGVSGAATATHGATIATQLQNTGLLSPGATQFLNSQTYNSSKPKAYINWILVDEQFKIVNSSSGFEQVGNNEEFKIHTRTDLPIDKSGYLYVYVSNETPNIDVFFDNLQVTHTRGPILEETHYYPFGLTMAGISSKAAGKLENKNKWNAGTELNTDFDINLYETFYRSLDPQIGRFWQIDPKPNYMESPYASMGNNPISYNDPLGDTLLTRADIRRANRIEKQINKTNASLNKQAAKLNNKIAAADAKGNTAKADRLRGDLADANARINTNSNTLGNLNAIRNDQTQAYTFNQLPSGSTEGGTMLKTMNVNGSNQSVVVMSVVSDANAVHELTHAFQSAIQNLFTLNLDNAANPATFLGATVLAAQQVNANTEVAAYQAQYAFSPVGMPSSTMGGVPSSMAGINAFYVGGINGKNAAGAAVPIYPNVQNMINTIFNSLRIGF